MTLRKTFMTQALDIHAKFTFNGKKKVFLLSSGAPAAVLFKDVKNA